MYKPTKVETEILDSIGYAAFKLWNVANYEKRNYKDLGMDKFPNWYDQKKRLKTNYFYKSLPSQTAQEVLKVLQGSWSSFFKLTKTGGVKNPQPPRYKQSAIQFTYLNNGFKMLEDGNIRFSIPKTLREILLKNNGMKIQYLVLKDNIFKQFSNIKQVRFTKLNSGYRISVIYEIAIMEPKQDNGKYLFIDLGVNNLFTCVDSVNNKSFILGKEYLSIQHYFNKQIAHYQSINSSQQFAKGVKYPKPSKRVLNFYNKRNNKTKDYLHKVTHYIAEYCNNNNITGVVIGDMTNIRKDKNLGNVNNQKLHALPFKTISDMLEYKLKRHGIVLIKQKELYSSQCPPDSKEVSYEYAQKSNRKNRGLYVADEKVYNADCVGAYNIGRLAMQNNLIQKIKVPTEVLSAPVKVAV